MYTRAARLCVLVLVSVSCASAPGAAPRRRTDYSVITAEQLEEQHYANVYEAVLALRSNWLSTRGSDSFYRPSQVWVYLDNTRLGGVQTLSNLSIQGVTAVRHLSGIEATARWGIGHSAGVIAVITWPSGERDSTESDSAGKAVDRPAPRGVRALAAAIGH